jgi:hypothetical protein
MWFLFQWGYLTSGPDSDDLYIGYCMGGPRAVPRSLDCHKTLPRIATTRIKKMGSLGLFCNVDKDSCVLLCKVSL